MSYRLLGVAFFAIFVAFSYSFAFMYGLVGQSVKLDCSLMMLYGPALYFYFKSLIHSDFKLLKGDSKHLIPHGVVLFWLYLSYFFKTPIEGNLLPADLSLTHFNCLTANFIGRIHFAFYLVLSYRAIRYTQQVVRQTQSAEHRLNLNWIYYLIGACFLIIVFSLFRFLSPLMGIGVLEQPLMVVELALLLLFVNSLLFKGLRQPSIFKGISAEDEKVVDNVSNKYASSKLEQAQSEQLLKRLLNYMKHEKPFLNYSITLNHLAKDLNIPAKQLSQIINQQLNQNFYEFINNYRIEEAKRLLSLPTNQDARINEVMYDAGFSSKSTFNNVFKKFTGQTPSQFKRALRNH